MNEKINILVKAIPDSIAVIDENIKILFSNPTFQDLLKEKTFVEFLEDSKYYKRLYDYIESEEIIIDMKNFFNFGNQSCKLLFFLYYYRIKKKVMEKNQFLLGFF